MRRIAFVLCLAQATYTAIDRRAIVSRYNPIRSNILSSGLTTPFQIGTGNFAFGADTTGLQTFAPFAILSSWGWKNDSLPPGKTIADVENYKGAEWPFHGNASREVQYDFGGDPEIEQWLISNPNRANLGRVGFAGFDDEEIDEQSQTLDIWMGTLKSNFSVRGQMVSVTTVCAQDEALDEQDIGVIGISITSPLLLAQDASQLKLFLDFPWNDGSSKFEAPFVGNFSAAFAGNHTTELSVFDNAIGTNSVRASILHTLVNATFITSIGGDSFTITRDDPISHRYTLTPSSSSNSSTFNLIIAYSLAPLPSSLPSFPTVLASSESAWEAYWTESGFVDVFTGSTDPRADELQRRIVLSRYLMRVNEAGKNPPQEVSVLLPLNSQLLHRADNDSVWTCK
jgi:hypothetical protein